MTDAPSPPLHIPPRPPLPTLPSPRSSSEARPNPARAESKRPTPLLARLTRDPRVYLLAYTLLLTGIAFWPVPVDQGAGPLLRLITKAVPALTYERIEFAANILLFVPLGLLLTLILVRNRWLVLPVAFLATVTIECVQALLLDARTPSVLDIVANTAGACIGILITVFIDALRASYRPRRLDEDSLISDELIWELADQYPSADMTHDTSQKPAIDTIAPAASISEVTSVTVEAQHVAPTGQLSSTAVQAPTSHAGAPLNEPNATTAPTPTAQPLDPWRERYARRLRITDFLVLVWVVYGTQLAWFGLGNAQVSIREDSRLSEFSYWAFSAVLIAIWMIALALADSRSERVIGVGPSEYARIVRASFGVFGAIAILAFLLRIDVARGYLLISLPLGIFMLLLTRWLWRQWLVAQRQMGRYTAKVLLVGSRQSVAQTARELQRTPSAGYHVVGACVPSGKIADTIEGTGIPIMGSVDRVERVLAITGADTVAVTSTDDLPANRVKQISWSLEAGKQHLVLAPSITDIAGPRVHTRPVAGLPLIHVETPRFSSGQRLTKRTVDLLLAGVGVVAISPLLLVIALSVKLSSPGPVLYRQERIGLNGRPFHMLKFRSMRVDADRELKALLEAQGTATQPLFKIKDDPRITPIGRFIRKYSLDELPQLLNVLGGSMSLVGPRPQIADEVALYTDAAKRRLLARPGVTGLWQVSGRSSIGWEEAVKLDLYYVENWSLVGDIAILARTASAVLRPGASAH